MSALGRSVGISMMLHSHLERDAARDAQTRDGDEADGAMIRLPRQTARSAARADIAMMLRLIRKDRPVKGADAVA